MNKINSPTQLWRSVCLSSALGCMVAISGLAIHHEARAQTTGSRTLATGTRLPLSATAPDQYTVKQGDTLWDISRTFLSQPWYWPELWYVNPQIQNPHLIYPGDILSLVNINGEPRLMLTERGGEQVTGGNGERLSPQVRSEDLGQAISTISYKSLESFLGRPSIISKDEVKSAPYLLHIRDKHIVGAAGDEVYARGIKNAVVGTRYNLIHVGQPLRDPDNNDLLGYYADYVGTGPLLSNGDPAKLQLTETVREALPGDKLYPETYQLSLDFVPHAPSSTVDGRIMAVDGVTVAGQANVVAINRGTKQGVEVGHVLAIYQAGEKVSDYYSDGRSANPMHKGNGFAKKIKIPDELAGNVMVFKTFERMSYALIMDASRPVGIGDYVRNP
ncbi:MAG: LysM peptidoglycan-binding domain-containing protein [Steroidobacteraceae bacterium]